MTVGLASQEKTDEKKGRASLFAIISFLLALVGTNVAVLLWMFFSPITIIVLWPFLLKPLSSVCTALYIPE